MNTYIVVITLIGVAALGMAWIPSITRKTNISYSLIYVLIGIIVYSIFKILPTPDPIVHETFTVHLTELVVIISLMGTGLKIDQPFNFKAWAVPFRLVTITMILCIALFALAAHYFLNIDWPAAILLGAVLAPTDPVLASDVQVGPPMEKRKDNVRFSLTAEAGLNDGMAFPFTWLAVVVAMMAENGTQEIFDWFARDFLYRIIAGVVCGIAIGRGLAYLVFTLPEKKKNLVVVKDGFVAVAATLLVYGITELVQGYGFIAVFVTAITLRNRELNHKFHKQLHDFTDQIERILIAIVLILFGGSIVYGILGHLTWEMVFLSIFFLLIIRPATALIATAGKKWHIKEKLAVSFFGIRGIGSFFYLSFALSQTGFEHPRQLWSLVSFIVLLSLLIHGITATSVMTKMEKRFSQKA